MGLLPGLVTTAQPEWLPFAVFAGAPLPADPRERRLREPRGIDVGGTARRVAWARDGRSLLVEVMLDGASCETVVSIALGRDPGGDARTGDARTGDPARRAVSAPASRGRLGAALAGGRVLIAEAPCAEPAAGAAWSLVDVDPSTSLRRVIARPQGEVLSVATDGTHAFVTSRDARGRGRVERTALDGGSARALLEGTAAWGALGVSPARATLVFVKETPSGGGQLVVASDGGGDPRPWSRGTARDADPAVLPDGTAMVFASTRAAAGKGAPESDPAQLYLGALGLGEADGGPAAERLTFAGDDNRSPALAPSGSDLAWVSDRAAPGGPRGVVLARFDGAP